jgi:ABC-2 type transport system permease protein
MSATTVTSMRSARALFRLELSEAMRSRWLAFTVAVYAVVFSGFVWFGMRESRVLGFTGLSRVVLNVANAVVLAVPLVALVATSQTIVRARQSGFFELMLSQPVRRADWLVSVVASRFLVVVGPLVVVLLGALVAGQVRGGEDAQLAPVVARSLLVTTSLAWAFLGIGFWISARAKTPERAMVMALVAWLCAAALHDFALVGVLLRFRLAPGVVFGLAAANPVEAARIAILGSVDPDLSVLGPVGFWLANKLGANLGLAIGAGWPALLGTLAMWRAQRRLVTADLVG